MKFRSVSAKKTVVTCWKVAVVTDPDAATAAAIVGNRALENAFKSPIVFQPSPISWSRLPAVSAVTDSAPAIDRHRLVPSSSRRPLRTAPQSIADSSTAAAPRIRCRTTPPACSRTRRRMRPTPPEKPVGL